MPPLRTRGAEDVRLLARHFAERAAAKTRRPGCRLTAPAEAALAARPWPGNVRELENTVFRAVALSEGPEVQPADLELDPRAGAAGEVGVEVTSWTDAVEGFERALLRQLYPSYPSSRKLAARLGASHTMIANRLRQFGLPEKPGR